MIGQEPLKNKKKAVTDLIVGHHWDRPFQCSVDISAIRDH